MREVGPHRVLHPGAAVRCNRERKGGLPSTAWPRQCYQRDIRATQELAQLTLLVRPSDQWRSQPRQGSTAIAIVVRRGFSAFASTGEVVERQAHQYRATNRQLAAFPAGNGIWRQAKRPCQPSLAQAQRHSSGVQFV